MSHRVVRGLPVAANRTVELEAGEHGAPVSVILVDMEAGRGPRLHSHPYAEVWIVRAGHARMTVGGETLEVGAGDAVVVEPEAPHGFTALGPERLEMVCVHAAGRFETHWLE